MRRLLTLLALLLTPAVAKADGLPSGGYPLDQVITFAGCEANGQSCHVLRVHFADIAGQNYFVFDDMTSWFRPGIDGEWRPVGMFGGGGIGGMCYPWFGDAEVSHLPTTIDGDGGTCENRLPDDWAPSGNTVTMQYILNDQSPSYSVTMTTTPEPASVVLMGTGLLMLVGVMRRMH